MLNPTNILLVEDDENLGATLNQYLNAVQYKTTWVKTVSEAKKEFKLNHFQIILLDIGLPDGDGIELACELRKIKKDFVFLFLSALNDPKTRLNGLEIGAEDYITKPFELKELIIRLKKIIKTQEDFITMPDEFIFGHLKLWPKRFEVMDGDGHIIPLSQKECALLELLLAHRNEAVSREEIINKIWGEEAYPSSRTVDNYIVKLRKWCETDKSETIKITSIRSIGYKLEIKNN